MHQDFLSAALTSVCHFTRAKPACTTLLPATYHLRSALVQPFSSQSVAPTREPIAPSRQPVDIFPCPSTILKFPSAITSNQPLADSARSTA